MSGAGWRGPFTPTISIGLAVDDLNGTRSTSGWGSVSPLMRPFAGSKPFGCSADSPRSTSRPLTLLPGPYLRRRASAAGLMTVVSLDGAQLDACYSWLRFPCSPELSWTCEKGLICCVTTQSLIFTNVMTLICKLSHSLSFSLSAQFGIAQTPSSKRYFPTSCNLLHNRVRSSCVFADLAVTEQNNLGILRTRGLHRRVGDWRCQALLRKEGPRLPEGVA